MSIGRSGGVSFRGILTVEDRSLPEPWTTISSRESPLPEGDDVRGHLALVRADRGRALLDEVVSSGANHGRIDLCPAAWSSVEAAGFRLSTHLF